MSLLRRRKRQPPRLRSARRLCGFLLDPVIAPQANWTYGPSRSLARAKCASSQARTTRVGTRKARVTTRVAMARHARSSRRAAVHEPAGHEHAASGAPLVRSAGAPRRDGGYSSLLIVAIGAPAWIASPSTIGRAVMMPAL